MSYGIKITNSKGQILIDGEHKLPKLHAHGRIYLGTQGHDSITGYYYYGYFDFPPTDSPVFITQAIDETAQFDEIRAIRTPYVIKDADGKFYRARLEAHGKSSGAGKVYVFVWVYVL